MIVQELTNFNTDSFTFLKPRFSEEEKVFLKELLDDELTAEFLEDLRTWLEWEEKGISERQNRATSIVYLSEVPIGILSLWLLDQEEVVISHGIAPAHRGKRFSQKIKEELNSYLFASFPNLNSITAYIDKTNNNNLASISRFGYDEIKEIKDGEQAYFKVCNYSPNYKKEIEGRKL